MNKRFWILKYKSYILYFSLPIFPFSEWSLDTRWCTPHKNETTQTLLQGEYALFHSEYEALGQIRVLYG